MSKKLFDDNDKIYAQKEDNNNKIYSVSDDEAKQRQVTFQTEDGKSYTTSLAAYQAIRGGYIDKYSPQDFEKEAVNHFKDLARQQKHAEDEARKEREPDNPVQGVLHSIGYTGGKILSGAADLIGDITNWGVGGLAKGLAKGFEIADKIMPGENRNVTGLVLDNFADKTLKSETAGEVWDKSIESRYKVPDWLRNHLGPTATNLGAMLPATIVEVATAGAAPGFESIAAKAALNKAALGTTAKSLGKNLLSKFKVAPLRTSEVVFGAGATASATKEAYAETGDFSKSLTKGVLNGLGEIFTERLFGGLGGTGIGADDAHDLINVGKSKILSKIASNKVGKKALDLTFEGLEEVIMAGAEPIFKKLTTNPDAKLSDLYKESDFSDSFLQGVLLSAFANVTTATVGKAIDTSNKHSAIRKLNKDAEAVNAKIASESDKITPLKHNATEEQIQNLNYEIQRKDAIVNFNAVADATNAMFKNDADKFELLKYDSTEDEIRERQNQLAVFANAYEELLLDEVVSTNPEVAKAIQDKVALESDDGAETNTTPATQENTTTIGTNQSVSTETPTVSVGETFIDKKLNQQIKVVARGTDTATIETTNLSTGNRVTKKLPVQLVDKMKVDSRYTQVTAPAAVAENATTANTSKSPDVSTVSSKRNISLAKVGNRYEVYGADAVELAEELDLETTKRVINGVETDVLLLPKRFAEGLNAEYGDKYNFVTSDSESTGATEVNQTNDGVNQVVDAMRETFEPGAEEKILSTIPPRLPRTVETFAQNLISAYNEHGNIGHISKLFVDGGKKVMSVMDGVLGKSVEVESKETSSHKKNEVVTNESNTTVDEAIGSALNEKVLKNEQESDTIKSKAKTSDSKSESVFIDDRTYEDVSSRNVKAFQFENPEVKPFFKAIAQELRNDLKNTTKGERFATGDFNAGTQEFTGTKRFTSESIARIKDATNATYDEIDNALERIINDEGQENIALAKKIELVMDDMLSDGYTTFDGYEISADNEYLALKEKLSGKEYETDSSESEELPLGLDNGTTQSVSGDIKETTEENSVEREDNGNENERSERTVEGRTVHNDGNVERTDGERTGRGGERVSRKTGNAQKTETERTVRKKIATTTFDEVKREHYTPEMNALEQGTYDKYGVVVKYFYGKCIDDSGVKGSAFYYNGVLYIQADAETSMESRIDHEITHHFGKSNAMTRFRNAVKAKMPKAVYDSWYSEIKEAYGDVLVSYLSKKMKNSNYTLTDAELQQLMDEYIEEEMLAKLNGGQVPFATEYKTEIETFRKEIGNYNTKNTKSKATSESETRNIPAEYTESIDAGGEETSDGRYDVDGSENKGETKNGTNRIGKTHKDGRMHNKSETKIASRNILQKGDRSSDRQSGLFRVDKRRGQTVERDSIQRVVEKKPFVKLSKYIVNTITLEQSGELYKKYKTDSRWDSGYEFDEMITYDMLSDETNTLRKLFSDEISEYFNGENLSANQDITGEYVSDENLKKSEGYDGIEYENNVESASGTSYILFDNSQIIQLGKEQFNVDDYDYGYDLDNNADVRYDLSEEDTYAPTFYSQMGKVTDAIKQEKIGVKDYLNYIKDPKRGVRNEEIKWSGIEEFLDGKKSVTKAELQEFVANNQLEIETETRLSDYTIEYTEDESKSLEEISEVTNEIWQNIDESWEQKYGDEIPWAIRYNDNAIGAMYQEINKLQRTDTTSGDFFNDIIRSLNRIEVLERNQNAIVERARARTLKRKANTKTKWDKYTLDGGGNYREITFKMPDSNYTNSAMQTHWGEDAKGILAHARVQDFEVDGKKMLFIEEIQSDWHNEGHKKGYSPKIQDSRLGKARAIHDAMNEPGIEFDEFNNLREEFEELRFELEMEGINIEDYINDDVVPDAPFKNNYHEFVLKRLIRMAAEQGYDSIGWTSADTQMDRWNPERLTNAELGVKDAKNPDAIAFEDGYRIEYDQDIPNFLNRYGKKWGAKVGKTEVDGTTVWSMDITDAMRDSVLYEGQARYSLADDGILDLEDLWKEANDTYGTIPKGENPVRDVDVPKKISKKDVVSRFARTMLEAGVTPDWAVSEFEKAILNGEMTHEVIEDKKTHKKVIKKIKEIGFEEALRDWDGNTRQGIISKENLVLGMELYNQAITNKDVRNAMKIAAELAAEATRAGQTLQACRMLKLMTPDGQLYYLEKSIQKMNEEFKEKLGDKFKDIELDESLMEEFFKETDETKRNEIYDKICQNIADQMPSTFRDHWDSWRYLAMLGNIRTHIRNIMGNAVFVPAVRIKTYVGAVIESSAGIEREKRTKSLLKRRDAVKFAKEDAEKIKKRLQGENAKYAITNDIESKRTIFKSKWFKWLEYLRRKNFDLLEKEDWWFLKAHYADALARLITVRKIDINSIDAKTLETLRKYAINEAQVATYRDANAIADGLNQLQRKLERSEKKPLRATGVLIEGVMPFKKTPMNIAKQGINYSPVGILKGIYKGLAKVKKGDATATEVIDDISKGLTGTGMMLIGLFMASMGWLVGSDDKSKKEKEFDKMVGEQSYSIKIGDGTYTIDWMTPSNLSLFIGAKLFDLTKDEFTFGDVVSAVSTLAEPLLELSVFSGLNGVIESAQYSDSAPIVAVGSDMITSYLMQGLPTIGGQLSRLMDETKREYYYVDKNSDMPKELQNFIGQAASKIPFASYLFQPAIDEWGREETYGNVVERAFENTISPGYYAEDNYTRVDKEIRKLFEETGDTAVLPTLQQKYYREDGVDYHMSPEDYTKVKKKRGKLSFQYVKELIYSDKYHSMSDEEKVEAIAKCYKTANKETKAEMLEKVKRKSKR